jgi:protein-tyrosine phosphatase
MAEGLLKKALPEIQISSAGLSAMVGHGADPMSLKIMAELGIDIARHRARMVNDSIIRGCDLILVMDNQQVQQISAQYPYTRGKVFRLGESIKQDIPDPYLHGEETFRIAFNLIASGCLAWEKQINSIR